MRNSKKRDKIIEIFKSGALLTSTEVIEKLPEIDRATVYRNLALLTSEGILREVNVKKGISSYELNREGDFHQHFICENCEKILPIEINLKSIIKSIPAGLKLNNFELNLKGRCSECA